MNTCLKVGVLVLVAVLLAAGAAQACESGDCLFPGLDPEQAAWLPLSPEALVLSCGGDACLVPGGEGFDRKGQAKPGMQLACESQPCWNRPDLEGSTPPALGGKQKSKPGIQLACESEPCNNRPDLNDERLALQNLRRQLYVCIAETCGLTPGLADTMLSCEGGPNCFAPVNEAEQTTTR